MTVERGRAVGLDGGDDPTLLVGEGGSMVGTAPWRWKMSATSSAGLMRRRA
jgi:hypothetical protein